MRDHGRVLRRLLPVLLALAALPAPAQAATLSAGEAVPRVCERASVGERPGVAVERYTARRSGW